MIGIAGSRFLLMMAAVVVSLILAACAPAAAPQAAPTATAPPGVAGFQATPPPAQPTAGPGAAPKAGQIPAVVRIGVSQPFTGDFAQNGDFARRGIDLAIEQLNQRNFIPGTRFEAVYEDDRDNPTEAVNIARKFAGDSSIVAVIGNFSSTASLATAPVYQQAGLVQISTTAAHPDFGDQGEYIFRLAVTTEFESPYIADWAVRDLKARRVAFVAANNDFGLAAAQLFLNRARELGAEVVGDEKYQPGEKDFRPMLTKLRSAQPDIIGTAAQYSDQALIDQQARQVGLTVPFISGGSLYSEEYLRLATGAANGNYVATPFWPGVDRPAAKEFFAAYQARYNTPPNKFPAFAYDAAMMVANAVQKAGSADRAAVRDALAALNDYRGVIGDIVAFDENREVKIQEEKLVVRDGQFVLWTP